MGRLAADDVHTPLSSPTPTPPFLPLSAPPKPKKKQIKNNPRQLPRSISSLAVRGDATFASCGDQGVVECHRVHVKGTYGLPKNAAAPAGSLLLLGDWLLATTTVSDAGVLRGALTRREWQVCSLHHES